MNRQIVTIFALKCVSFDTDKHVENSGLWAGYNIDPNFDLLYIFTAQPLL